MKKLAIAILAAFTLGAASQYTYERKIDTKVTITAERAGTYLSLLRTDKAWPVNVPIDALYHCDLWNERTSYVVDGVTTMETTAFKVECHGKETGAKVPADMLPEGATVEKIHN